VNDDTTGRQMLGNQATKMVSGVRKDFGLVEFLQNRDSDFHIMPTKTNLGEFTPVKPSCSKGEKG
jgi:hypothetical protein